MAKVTKYEFTDRYKALGIPYPDTRMMCKGQCEGTGRVPVLRRGKWHFKICSDCNGSGKIGSRD